MSDIERIQTKYGRIFDAVPRYTPEQRAEVLWALNSLYCMGCGLPLDECMDQQPNGECCNTALVGVTAKQCPECKTIHMNTVWVAPTETVEHGEDDERKYPCAHPGCDVMRTKAEGGTVFTVCEEHWKEHWARGEDDISDFLDGPPPALDEKPCGEDDIVERLRRHFATEDWQIMGLLADLREAADEIERLRSQEGERIEGWPCGCKPWSSNPDDYCPEHQLRLGSQEQRIHAVWLYLKRLLSEPVGTPIGDDE